VGITIPCLLHQIVTPADVPSRQCYRFVRLFARARTYARTVPHEHGPKIFLDYDQVELDAAYDQPTYAFNGRQVGQRQAANTSRCASA